MTEAQKKANARYREKNREKLLQYNKEYYQKNIEELKAKRKKFRDENKEKIKQRNREYYLRKKEERLNGKSDSTSREKRQ